MTTPTKSYRIWHTPRVGSSLLCKLLEQTGVAGTPGEHLTLHGEEHLKEKYQVQTYAEFKQKFWELGSGGQNIMGLKKGYHIGHDTPLFQELCQLRNLPFDTSPALLYQDLMPNCKHIFLVRNHKIRQIVSWWKAIQDNTWHLTTGQKRTQTAHFYKDKYNLDAFRHLYYEITLREAAAQSYLEENGYIALTVAYEDLVAQPKDVLNRVLHFLEIDHQVTQAPHFYYKKTANAQSEEWVQRLRQDFQKGWDKPAW